MDPYELNNNVDLGFIDFMDEANLEQFIELIRTEAEEPADDLRHLKLSSLYDFDSFPDETPAKKNGGSGECLPPTTPATKQTKRTDRSRTIISERKRRSSMKDKLYALRSLVPYITKMDKASIIGDAIHYLQELQQKINELKGEIADLESSLYKPVGVTFLQDCSSVMTEPPPIKQILQMEVFQVELREFYVRIMCKKSEGVAALLYRSLDSTGLNVQSSNLATTHDLNYLFTFTLNINKFEIEINLQNLKPWIAAALCDQGFHFVTPPSAN